MWDVIKYQNETENFISKIETFAIVPHRKVMKGVTNEQHDPVMINWFLQQ